MWLMKINIYLSFMIHEIEIVAPLGLRIQLVGWNLYQNVYPTGVQNIAAYLIIICKIKNETKTLFLRKIIYLVKLKDLQHINDLAIKLLLRFIFVFEKVFIYL